MNWEVFIVTITGVGGFFLFVGGLTTVCAEAEYQTFNKAGAIVAFIGLLLGAISLGIVS